MLACTHLSLSVDRLFRTSCVHGVKKSSVPGLFRHNVLEVCLPGTMCQDSLLFKDCVLFHCMDRLHFVSVYGHGHSSTVDIFTDAVGNTRVRLHSHWFPTLLSSLTFGGRPVSTGQFLCVRELLGGQGSRNHTMVPPSLDLLHILKGQPGAEHATTVSTHHWALESPVQPRANSLPDPRPNMSTLGSWGDSRKC
jgi:hypothetical protein